MDTFDIYHDLTLKASVNEVFDRITKPEHLENWWPQKCTGTPKLGESYNFYFTPDYDWFGVVAEFEQNKKFYIEMTESDEDWDDTVLKFDIEQNKESVLLKFSHTGWPSCNQHFRRSSFCWAMLLNGLKNYCEKGIIIPFEERE